MKYEYVLLDLDGTLTDPEEGITKSIRYALASFGIEECDRSKLRSFIGPPLKSSFQDFYGMSDENADLAIARYRERFADKGLYENTVYPGVENYSPRSRRRELAWHWPPRSLRCMRCASLSILTSMDTSTSPSVASWTVRVPRKPTLLPVLSLISPRPIERSSLWWAIGAMTWLAHDRTESIPSACFTVMARAKSLSKAKQDISPSRSTGFLVFSAISFFLRFAFILRKQRHGRIAGWIEPHPRCGRPPYAAWSVRVLFSSLPVLLSSLSVLLSGVMHCRAQSGVG